MRASGWSQAHKACQRNGLYGVLVSLEKFTAVLKFTSL